MVGSLNETFGALSSDIRREMLSRLRFGDLTAGELAAPHQITLTGALKHLGQLESAGLVTREKVGRTVWCRLNASPLRAASDWVGTYRQFWEGRLDDLAIHLESRRLKD